MPNANAISDLKRCLLLLPGYELEGFPRFLPREEAAALLAGWASLWHPALIKRMQNIPAWQQASSSPGDIAGSLLILPEIAKSELDPIFESAEDCLLQEPHSDWMELQRELLELSGIGGSERAELQDKLTEQQLCEFAALGYAYLQIQLMTRQLRYTSNLDQLLFAEQVVAAAEAILAGEAEKAEESLQACFDTLGQERDHYYSLDLHLLDVTLLAPTVLGKSLTRQLSEQSEPTSFLASASLLRQMKQEQPKNFAALSAQVNSGDSSLLGGLDAERSHSLMPRESLSRDLHRGKIAYAELDLPEPTCFARMSFGMITDHAADLKRFGYQGVFLTAWSEGSYPEGSQTKISWEASDGTFISAIASEVRDASDASSFLALGWDIGDALDHQHVPTLVFAHWPGQTSDYANWLSMIEKRTPALGRWSHGTPYFCDTDDPYHQERLNTSDFKYNWLARSEAPAKLLEATRALQVIASRCRSLQNLANLAWQLEHYKPQPVGNTLREEETSQAREEGGEDSTSDFSDSAGADSQVEPQEEPPHKTSDCAFSSDLRGLIELCDGFLDSYSQKDVASDQQRALELADRCSDEIISKLQTLLCPSTPPAKSGEEPTGRLLINSRSLAQRIRVQTAAEKQFADAGWKYASGRVGHDRYSCLDVPSFGFVVAPFADKASNPKQQHLAELGGVVQNEFLEAQVDNRRGHLKSLYMPGRRGNRLSLMLARRDRFDNGKFSYSEMQAKDVRMLTSSNICGLVRASGRLVLDGESQAEFEIDYELWRGSRVMEVATRLKGMKPLANSNPWRSAYVLRLAWPTEAAILNSFQCGRRHPMANGQTVSPALIEIDESEYCTHYLTGGLAFHRRTESRFLETILPFDSKESESRIGIGVDLPQPLQMAEDFLDRRYSLPLSGKVQEAQAWLTSVNAKNVIVHLESPLVNDSGETVGLRLFVQETQGRSSNAVIRLMHDAKAANRVDYLGVSIGKLTTNHDSITIALRANEQTNVDVLWR
ncbi:MAG: hypothetical protein VXZ82_07835 [Planctomycetota bacterium]|nr:hypothetical protein [Planctomycetota bacterium]